MKRVKIKVPAKINLTLDITGVKDGYHHLKSIVSSINLYDTITLIKRNDDKITLLEKGIESGCDTQKNNAFKACKAFINKFGTTGVDIVLNKKIPVGGGLGGSSADIAGVLNGMKKLFGIDGSVKDLADELGSDSRYMLEGGWAVISERGNKVKKLKIRIPKRE